MSHITPVLTTLIAALKKSTMSLNRDFAEIESLQTSINGANNFSQLSLKKVEECLAVELKTYRPNFPIYKNADSIKENCFLVSVSDNFTNFNKGLESCTISVVLIENSETIAAVAFNPATKNMYFAQKGKGAFIEGIRNHERLRVSGQKDISKAIISTDIKNFKTVTKISDNIKVLGTSLMDFIYVAAGKFDAGLFSKVDICTLAAGALFIKESGGYSYAPTQKDFRSQDLELIFSKKDVLITNNNLSKTLPEVL